MLLFFLCCAFFTVTFYPCGSWTQDGKWFHKKTNLIPVMDFICLQYENAYTRGIEVHDASEVDPAKQALTLYKKVVLDVTDFPGSSRISCPDV